MQRQRISRRQNVRVSSDFSSPMLDEQRESVRDQAGYELVVHAVRGHELRDYKKCSS
jgi:hypothetical protein